MIVHFKGFFKCFEKRGEKMQRAAVICEFNPFHNGHKFLLEKIKTAYADEIVCIMSGSFVQRGDIAITDKYARTRAALENGADLVAELPTVYAMASARVFAQSGVRLAAALRCDTLCFGAEDGLEELNALVRLLDSDEVNRKIGAGMQAGLYYPKALSEALGAEHAALLEKPNNILAVEYIRACGEYAIEPVAIRREGVPHDAEAACGNIASASHIRSLIRAGAPYRAYTPMEVARPAELSAIEPAILYRLRTIGTQELRQTADVSEGLEHRIIEAAKEYHSFTEICEAVKTKRYTMARIRRILLSAFLGITREMQTTPVPYCRVLGVKNGAEHLMKGASVPLIVKTKADYDRLDDSAKEIFRVDIRAAEALNLARKTNLNEFSQGVVKVG